MIYVVVVPVLTILTLLLWRSRNPPSMGYLTYAALAGIVILFVLIDTGRIYDIPSFRIGDSLYQVEQLRREVRQSLLGYEQEVFGRDHLLDRVEIEHVPANAPFIYAVQFPLQHEAVSDSVIIWENDVPIAPTRFAVDGRIVVVKIAIDPRQQPPDYVIRYFRVPNLGAGDKSPTSPEPGRQSDRSHLNSKDVALLVAGGAIGFLASLCAAFGFEWLRKPSLRVGVGSVSDHPGGAYRFVHIDVANVGLLPRLLRARPASLCRASLTFCDAVTGTARFTLEGRWSSRREPLIYLPGQAPFPDPGAALTGHRETIVQGDPPHSIVVAIKHEGDVNCYGFNDRSYLSEGGRNPEWALPEGRYLVRCEVAFEEGDAATDFLLGNRGEHRDGLALSLSPLRPDTAV